MIRNQVTEDEDAMQAENGDEEDYNEEYEKTGLTRLLFLLLISNFYHINLMCKASTYGSTEPSCNHVNIQISLLRKRAAHDE